MMQRQSPNDLIHEAEDLSNSHWREHARDVYSSYVGSFAAFVRLNQPDLVNPDLLRKMTMEKKPCWREIAKDYYLRKPIPSTPMF